jgi:hypothetical protein
MLHDQSFQRHPADFIIAIQRGPRLASRFTPPRRNFRALEPVRMNRYDLSASINAWMLSSMAGAF